MTDGTYLYVGFDAKQRTPIQASQHTNDVGEGSDDTVSVYVSPAGLNGFDYGFTANPIGTHYQFSTENTSYAPSWTSAGRLVPGGYTVTMRVPLEALRGGTDKPWRIQFERNILLTLDDYVWSYDPAEDSADNTLYAGYLSGLERKVAARPQARFGLYALAAIAPKDAGGSTSRVGLDASIPITAGTSLVAALHPDYSNVEQDQQSIAPTAFARYFNEVRPFFTQLSNFYNAFNCIGCPGIQELYTPLIPTPRDGYAIEGKQGPFSFAGFDAIGVDRVDSAQALGYVTPNQKDAFSAQRVSLDERTSSGSQIKDDAMLYGVSNDSLKGLFEYYDFGTDSGSFVTDPGQAQRNDAGIGIYDKNSFAGASIRRFGPQYFPLDAYVQQPDLAGYDVNADRTWYRSTDAAIIRVISYVNIDRYHDSTGALDLIDNQAAIGLTFQHRVHVRLQTGSSYTRIYNDFGGSNFVPVNQNGIDLYLNYDTSVPTTISYYTGRYGPGRVDSWSRSNTLRIGSRATMTFEANDNVQWLDVGGAPNTSWLERASLALQNGSSSSLALGVRRILGTFPLLELPPSLPLPRSSFNAWNVSGAYYKRLPNDELYLVYGDASAFSTAPALTLKVIHYFGAAKGT
jgi:hypothetical protein